MKSSILVSCQMSHVGLSEKACLWANMLNECTVVLFGSAGELHMFFMPALIGAVSAAALLLLLLLVVLYKWKQVCLLMILFHV